jgi:hypothetical protein
MGRFIDLTGKRFGKLTVIKIDSKDKFRHLRWLCKCDCGNETVVLSDNLKRNHTKSCGCEITRVNSEVHKKHGKRYTPNGQSREYTIWCNMLGRCKNPKRPDYCHYGGRGIKVCKKWHAFEGFWEDMRATYRDGLTLERIDVNGDYCPENCRWATMPEQANNKTNNHHVNYNGEKMTLKEACEKQGINYSTVFGRLKLGWDFEKAIKTPIRKHTWRNKDGA